MMALILASGLLAGCASDSCRTSMRDIRLGQTQGLRPECNTREAAPAAPAAQPEKSKP